MKLRILRPDDASKVLAVQRISPGAANWSERDYERLAESGMTGWAVEYEHDVAGFLVVRSVHDELEILNLAVAPQFRLKGAGGELLRQALEWGKSFGTVRAHLEVRASNEGAIRFYTKHSFEVAGRRLSYYTNPTEDALLLTRSLNAQ